MAMPRIMQKSQKPPMMKLLTAVRWAFLLLPRLIKAYRVISRPSQKNNSGTKLLARMAPLDRAAVRNR
jgi:hypothetical protein